MLIYLSAACRTYAPSSNFIFFPHTGQRGTRAKSLANASFTVPNVSPPARSRLSVWMSGRGFCGYFSTSSGCGRRANTSAV